MSEHPVNSPDSSQSDANLKSLIVKGIVGAVSLAGATAIPLMVQQFLSPQPAPPPPAATSPTPQQPITAQPIPQSPGSTLVPVQSQEVTETSIDVKELEKILRNQERRRGREDDDDDD